MGGRRSHSRSTRVLNLLHLLVILSSSAVAYTAAALDTLIQLPQSGFSYRARPRFKTALLLVTDFGANGDGVSDDTEAFKAAWEVACSFSGQARIVIPAGKLFLVHPVDLAGPCRSRVVFWISGTIVAPKDPTAWDGLNPRKWLYFHGVNHLTIEGGGTIMGMGQKWWEQSCKINKTNPCQHAPTVGPALSIGEAITFHKCKNLKIKSLIMENSQQMHIAFTNCRRVVASQLIVLAPAFSPNTDGIHISSSTGIEIKDSIVRTGDDCISIVGNSSRIQIRHVVCGPGHGISIGSLGKLNARSQVRDVMVDGAFISNTENGVRIKSWQGGSGFATGITFQNILMENVSNPIIIDQYYCDSLFPCLNQSLAVKVENISFVNIRGTSATEEAIRFACSDDSPCEGLYLENIKIVSSYIERITRSYCWQANGLSRGVVFPASCFWSNKASIKQKVTPDLSLQYF